MQVFLQKLLSEYHILAIVDTFLLETYQLPWNCETLKQ